MYGSTRSKEKAKDATQTLIQKHLNALSKFSDDKLEKILNESDKDVLAAGDEAGSVSGANESDSSESMNEDNAVEMEPVDNEEAEYQIVCSRKYKSAVMGMRLNDAGM